MNILPTSCDGEGFRKINSQNYGWELRVEVMGKTMEEVLSNTVLYGMVKEVPVSPEFSWMSGDIKKHYIIEGAARLSEIKAKLEVQEKYDLQDDEVLEGDTGGESSYKLKLLTYTEGDFAGTIAFEVTNECDMKGKEIIKGYPIDLFTYLRVPRKFGKTSKFLPIALFSPTQVGKSTLLASFLAKGLKKLPVEYKHEPGHWEEEGDYVYDWYKAQRDAMYNGICPALTQPTYKVPPVFINLLIPDINEDGDATGPADTVTVGIYDFSGESLDKSGAGYDIVKMLQFMKGIIYLTGPEIVPGFDENKLNENETTIWNEGPVKIRTLTEQAEYQNENGARHVKGLAANRRMENPAPATGGSASEEFYRRVVRYIGSDKLPNIHLAFVIAQSDRLEGQTCMSDIVGVEWLFEHDSMQGDLYQSDDKNIKNFKELRKKEERIIKGILPSGEKRMYEEYHGVHVSYHMVSATGCKCEQIVQVNGEGSRSSFDSKKYDPIRVAEPFLVCIREMLRNGMYYKPEEEQKT